MLWDEENRVFMEDVEALENEVVDNVTGGDLFGDAGGPQLNHGFPDVFGPGVSTLGAGLDVDMNAVGGDNGGDDDGDHEGEGDGDMKE